MNDAPLQAELARRLDHSFELLVLTYEDRLYRFGLRMSGNPQDAEEIAQDAFVRAYHALGGYSAERIRSLAMGAWLYQITLNVFRNRTRRRKVRQVPLDGQLCVKEGEKLPEEIAEDVERRHELAGLLATLPRRQRVAIVLRHIEELSYAEVAAVLEQPVGTVKSHVHRGLQTLRATLISERSEVSG